MAFNAVDGLILSWFMSLPLKNAPLHTMGLAAEALMESGDLSEEQAEFAQTVASSPRFRDVRLYRFEEKFSEAEEMQFAAMTFLTRDGRAFVAFRGTDSTLVGWKEDFNMAVLDEVPAQREAALYLNGIAGALPMPLRAGGHSKGGNLAVYAAAKAEPAAQARIESVYNFDGPGMRAEFLTSPGYKAIETRVETYLPEESVVGILLEQAERYNVVKSDARGVMQHHPLSWQTLPSGFEQAQALNWQSLYADRTLRSWLESMSRSERERLVETLYDIVESTDARTLSDVSANWQSSARKMLETFAGLDLRTKAALFLSLGKLVKSAVGSLNAS